MDKPGFVPPIVTFLVSTHVVSFELPKIARLHPAKMKIWPLPYVEDNRCIPHGYRPVYKHIYDH